VTEPGPGSGPARPPRPARPLRPPRPSRRQRLRGLILDVSPLRRDPDFRRIWTGQGISAIGNQITRITLPFQVYALTGSPLAIAALTACQLVPIVLFSLGGGSIADAVDRRRLLLVTQVAMAMASLMLAAIALGVLGAQPPLAAILVVAFVAAGVGAVDQPTRTSAIPRLVPPERLPAAIALNQLSGQTAQVIGPAVGGLLIATVDVGGAYLVDVATFSASLVAIVGMRPLPPLPGAARPGLAAVREGLAFARRNRLLLSTFVIDLNAMIFGMPAALFPVLALEVFHVGPEGFGLIAAAPGFGAFFGALLSGWVARVRDVGRAIIAAVVVWGAAIAAFGLATFSFPLALAFLAIAGAADVLSAVFRSTAVQLETPDQLRGRVSALHILVVTSGPRLGDLEAATLASVVGAQASVVSGGVLCILGVAVVARIFPELAAYRPRILAGPAGPAPGPAGKREERDTCGPDRRRVYRAHERADRDDPG
jgi:MFS family permease